MLLGYTNGILVLWDLHRRAVVATRGGSDVQRTMIEEVSPSPPRAQDVPCVCVLSDAEESTRNRA